MGSGQNPPRSHAFAAAFEPRKSFVTFSIPKSKRIKMHFEEYNPFQLKTTKKQPNQAPFTQPPRRKKKESV